MLGLIKISLQTQVIKWVLKLIENKGKKMKQKKNTRNPKPPEKLVKELSLLPG